MIKRTGDGYRAGCNGLQGCESSYTGDGSEKSFRAQLKRKGWWSQPAEWNGVRNRGVTICPACLPLLNDTRNGLEFGNVPREER